jgi:hypothetical protein
MTDQWQTEKNVEESSCVIIEVLSPNLHGRTEGKP